MDLIDQILGGNRGKRYANSKGGYIETNTILFRESETTFRLLESLFMLHKVADVGIDLESITLVTAFMGKEQKIPKGALTFIDSTNVTDLNAGLRIAVVDVMGDVYPLVAVTDETFEYGAGTWLARIEADQYTGNAYVISVEYETVHPIDPKFLPGVCLPVVELSTVATAEGAALTAEEAAKIDAIGGSLFILKFNANVTVDTAVSTFHVQGVTYSLENGLMYFFDTPVLTMQLQPNENGWVINAFPKV